MLWVDIIILIALGVGLLQGFGRGFVSQVFQVIALILAMGITFWIFPHIGDWMEREFHLPLSLARPLSLALVFFVASFFFQFAATLLHKLTAPVVQANMINRLLGAALGIARNGVITSIVLALLVTLPLPAKARSAIDGSRLGGPLIHFALSLEQVLSKWFHEDTLRSLGYQIVATDATTTTALNYTVADPKEDLADEAKMLLLTNEIRKRNGRLPLTPNLALHDVALLHGKDMVTKGYFSHISPQGKDALVRVQEAGITVTAVGENLANASSVEIAELGLLGSEGHRKNILSGEFNQIGIAVLDAGAHGKMVVEVFARIY